eukprot:1189089-Prorocentrum_minimum.AAC.4
MARRGEEWGSTRTYYGVRKELVGESNPLHRAEKLGPGVPRPHRHVAVTSVRALEVCPPGARTAHEPARHLVRGVQRVLLHPIEDPAHDPMAQGYPHGEQLECDERVRANGGLVTVLQVPLDVIRLVWEGLHQVLLQRVLH